MLVFLILPFGGIIRTHTTGIFYPAYTIREANPEPNTTRFLVGGPVPFLSYLDAQRGLHQGVGVGSRVRLRTDRVRQGEEQGQGGRDSPQRMDVRYLPSPGPAREGGRCGIHRGGGQIRGWQEGSGGQAISRVIGLVLVINNDGGGFHVTSVAGVGMTTERI